MKKIIMKAVRLFNRKTEANPIQKAPLILDVPKITIELTPYHALMLYSFAMSSKCLYKQYSFEFTGTKESIEAFENEICSKITKQQIEDAWAEHAVNRLLGKDV